MPMCLRLPKWVLASMQTLIFLLSMRLFGSASAKNTTLLTNAMFAILPSLPTKDANSYQHYWFFIYFIDNTLPAIQ